MHRFSLAACVHLLAISSASLAQPASQPASTDWVSLFDGKDLTGWTAHGDGKFSVVDGAILCEGTMQQHGWLIHGKPVDNFLLKLRFKWERGNTGIQFRSSYENNEMIGYQADLDFSNAPTTGTLHEQGGRRMLQKTFLDARTICDVNGWNEYEILAVGDHIQLFINGVQTADFRDSRAARGIVAFQAHAEQNSRVFYKDIRLLPLPAHARYQPMINGKDLSNWRQLGEEKWTLEDSRIIGRSGPKQGYGWLIADRPYSDFVIKFKFFWHGGNSGVQFRSWVAEGHMHGYQADLDPTIKNMTGGLYDEREQGTLAATPPEIDASLKKDGWNTYEISAIGDHIQLFINGLKSVDLRHGRTPKGIIALQVHSGGPVHMEWKDVYILDLAAPRTPTSTQVGK